MHKRSTRTPTDKAREALRTSHSHSLGSLGRSSKLERSLGSLQDRLPGRRRRQAEARKRVALLTLLGGAVAALVLAPRALSSTQREDEAEA